MVTVHRARCYVADERGRRVERSATADTRPKARRRLLDALGRSAARPSVITGKTRLRIFADVMFDEKRERVASGQLSPGTLSLYEGHWRRYLEPALGEMAIEWLTVRCVDDYLKALRGVRSYATVKGVRTVLTEMADVAVRYDVLPRNTVRQAADIPGDGGGRVKALSAQEAVDVWYRLVDLAATPAPRAVNNRRYRPTLCDPMVPDLWLWMLGTGARISQALAVQWSWLHLDASPATADIGPNVICPRGERPRLSAGRSKSREARIDLPEQVVAMLRVRQGLPGYAPDGPVFPSADGGLLDPSNVSSKKLRPALVAIERPDVSSHWARRTLGSELDAAGLSLTDIAGRLGHSDTRTTERHYTRKRSLNSRVVAATEAMLAAARPGEPRNR